MTVSRKTHQIVINNSLIQCSEGDNLLTSLNANKVSISQSCEGNATCTTCRIFVLKGIEHCSPRTEIEAERASEREFENHERLACQVFIYGDIEIEIPDSKARD